MWKTYPLMQQKTFGTFGQVTSTTVVKDKYSGQSRGFGFDEMLIESQARQRKLTGDL